MNYILTNKIIMLKCGVFFSFILFLLSACDKSEINKELPQCIEEIINKGTGPFNTIGSVQSQIIDGENHYWLNTNARYFDGPEVIVNTSCDTVCWFCGFCVQPACIEKYATTWDTIWTK